MKKSLFIISAALLTLASCDEEAVVNISLVPQANKVLTASFEQDGSATRMNIASTDNALTWSELDAIAVFGETSSVEYTLSAGAETASGTFTTTGAAPETIVGVAFPYSENATLTEGTLTMTLSSARDQTTEGACDLPMWGTVTEGKIAFKHLAGLLKVDLRNIPAGYNTLTVTASNPIAGAFTVNTGDETPVLTAADDNENKTVTVSFTAATEGTKSQVLYLPLPVGTYESIVVSITDATNTKVLKQWANKIVARAKVYKTSADCDTYVTTAAELTNAIAAAEAGATINLGADITMSDILVIDEGITLNGNGHTLTSSAGRAINVSGAKANGVTIQNLTIECTGERGINIIQSATNVTIDNVTIDADNYAVNIAGSAPNAEVTIQYSDLTGLNVVNVGGVNAQVTVTGTELTNDNTKNDNNQYAILCLNKDATGGSSIAATDCTFNLGTNTVKGRNDTADGTITIDGTIDDVEETVAYIDYGTYYKPRATFEEIVEVAEAGNTITLIRDITASEIITINKAITLDGNDKTLTSSAGRAINVSGANGVTIQNLIIECSGERGINIIQSATNVTINNVTATADNYTVSVAGSAPNAVVTITESTLTGKNVVNVAAARANVTVTDSELICNDDNANAAENYAALSLNKDATDGTITATGTTITVTDGSDSVPARNDAEGGTITIDGSAEGVVQSVAVIEYGNYYADYTTLQAAIDAATSGQTIKLIRDITLTSKIIANKAITLDLNGKTLTENGQSSEAGDYRMTFNGNFTIKNGTINTTSRFPIVIGNADRITGAFEDVDIVGTRSGEIPNSVNGTVILIGDAEVSFDSDCTINATGYTCAIEGSCNDAMTSSANITINGAAITLVNGSTYEYETVLGAGYGSTINVTGGTIDGSQAANAVLTYPTGGTINISGGIINGTLYKYEPYSGKTSTINVTGGTFSAEPTEFVAEGYTASQSQIDNSWTVSQNDQ